MVKIKEKKKEKRKLNSGKKLNSAVVKINSAVVKINFPLSHPQTSLPATRAVTVHSFDWLAFAVKLVWWAALAVVPVKWRVPNFAGTACHSPG